MNLAIYQDQLLPYWRKKCDRKYLFQNDNYLKYTCKLTKQWFSHKKNPLLKLPPKSNRKSLERAWQTCAGLQIFQLGRISPKKWNKSEKKTYHRRFSTVYWTGVTPLHITVLIDVFITRKYQLEMFLITVFLKHHFFLNLPRDFFENPLHMGTFRN